MSYFQYIKSHRTHGSATTIMRVVDLFQRTQHAMYVNVPKTPIRSEQGTLGAPGFGSFADKLDSANTTAQKVQKVPYEPTHSIKMYSMSEEVYRREPGDEIDR